VSIAASTYKTLIVLFSIVIGAALLVVYYVSLNNREDKSSTANLSLTANNDEPFIDGTGAVVDLAAYSNKIRVVNSWASWSPLSNEELPLLDNIAETYQAQGIIFLAINRKENKDYALGYLASLPPLNNLKIIFDPADNFFTKVKGYAMPETIIFDKSGDVVAHYRGLFNRGQLTEVLDTLLEK